MSVENPPSPRIEPASPAEETRAPAPLGWLQSLRARLGLQGPQTLRETLEVALKAEDPQAGAFSAEERDMLIRLLRFGGLRVDDVMVPRADIIAIEESEPLGELLALFDEAGVSRIPLFHDTLDDPRGMVHIKDVLSWLLAEASGRVQVAGEAASARPAAVAARAAAGGDVAAIGDAASGEPVAPGDIDLSRCDLARPISSVKIRRPVLFVPASMPAQNLLIRMQTTRIHMAIVVDEYGGTDGLITIEDLVEQVVGEIEDEHDEREDALIYRDKTLGLVASARVAVSDLEASLGIALLTDEEREDIDTLGGLVFSIVGRVPVRGEIVRHAAGVEFEVLDADARRVKKLKIHEIKPAGDAAAGER